MTECDIMSRAVETLLHIPRKCIRAQTDSTCVCLVTQGWIDSLLINNSFAVETPPELVVISEADAASLLAPSNLENLCNFIRIQVEVIPRSKNLVQSYLREVHAEKHPEDGLFSYLANWDKLIKRQGLQTLAVKHPTYSNIDYFNAPGRIEKPTTFDEVLGSALSRMFHCPILMLDGQLQVIDRHTECSGSHLHITEPLFILCTSAYWIIAKPYKLLTLHDLVTFSPSCLAGSIAKKMFIIYQLLLTLRHLHKLGISLGSLTLHDISIENNLWISLSLPKVAALCGPSISIPSPSVHLNSTDLSLFTCAWVQRKISNFDYLMKLNDLTGRAMCDANHHPILPWVSNFSARGSGFRDLTKSKYRLNKGDHQLDLTHESSVDCTPHHISDMLSDITYYVYMARRLPKSLLCTHVRSKWVPNEYPASIQRLQEWTPDECIPEFFTDPTVFTSMHSDMPDLILPDWAQNAQDFIDVHREMLESEAVSSKLHHWIDLTFGYKLSGTAAVKSKNVCLQLVDNHTEPIRHGAVQLLWLPHPPRTALTSSNLTFPPPMISQIATKNKKTEVPIKLASGVNPLQTLDQFESLYQFCLDTSKQVPPYRENVDSFQHLLDNIEARDVQAVGCCIVELYESHRLRAIVGNASLVERYTAIRKLSKLYHNLPRALRFVVDWLLQLQRPWSDSSSPVGELFSYADIAELPSPSPAILLHPSVVPFPSYFPILHSSLSRLFQLNKTLQENGSKIGKEKVKILLNLLHSDQLDEAGVNIVIPFVIELFQDSSINITAVWALFHTVSRLLGPVATRDVLMKHILALYDVDGMTAKHIKLFHQTFVLQLIIRFELRPFLSHFIAPIVEAVAGFKDFAQEEGHDVAEGINVNEVSELGVDTEVLPGEIYSDTLGASEHASVGYEEIVFGQKPDDTTSSSSLHSITHLSPSAPDKSSRDSEEDADVAPVECPSVVVPESAGGGYNISDVATNTLLWLSNRLGPTLTAKHIARNLLKMLSVCYFNDEQLEPSCLPGHDLSTTGRHVLGDIHAKLLLHCLRSIAVLYGDKLILHQYLPHIAELVAASSRKLSLRLEAGILSSMNLLLMCLPLLTDALLMDVLKDNLFEKIMLPILQLVSSSSISFPRGSRSRKILAHKLVDVMCFVSLRIGFEMTRQHMTRLLRDFFAVFSMVHNDVGKQPWTKIPSENSGVKNMMCHQRQLSGSYKLQMIADAEKEEHKFLLDSNQEEILMELSQTFTAEMAHIAYIPFCRLAGGIHMEQKLANDSLIRRLSAQHDDAQLRGRRPPVVRDGLGSGDTSVGGGRGGGTASIEGNKIIILNRPPSSPERVVQIDYEKLRDVNMCSSRQRHLEGNWLACWQNNIGLSDWESHFHLKQVQLQTFVGHTGSIRSIHVLNNENSFMSASKDKKVRLWSIASCGDGNSKTKSQWSYTSHKKSVFSVTFMDSLRYAASCDGSLHIWDPFVGMAVRQYDPSKNGALSVLSAAPAPSKLLVCAAQEPGIKLVDVRLAGSGEAFTLSLSKEHAASLKCNTVPAGPVRCLCVSSDGTLVVAGHSAGLLSVLDIRTGLVVGSWKPHEAEVLQVKCLDAKTFASSSFDQTLSFLSLDSAKISHQIKGFPEAAHCLCTYKSDVISATTANRFGVHTYNNAQNVYHGTKLQGGIFRGIVTTFSVLQENKLMLLGADDGSIKLLA